jgi:hypothetical protein
MPFSTARLSAVFILTAAFPVAADVSLPKVRTIKPAAEAKSGAPATTTQLPKITTTPPAGAATSTRSAAGKKSDPFPWRRNIVTTVFWVGERPAGRNTTSNHASSWDRQWQVSFGGYDDPDPEHRSGYRPKKFLPGQNPFYVALPYNDVAGYGQTRHEAARVIPWFKERFTRPGKTVCKGQWIAIRHNGKVCYAQWEDCGPFHTDDWMYVFGNSRPKNHENSGAGLDVSPAVRDHLKLKSGGVCDWKFVSVDNVPAGPWRTYGDNNPFVLAQRDIPSQKKDEFERLREQRDEWLKKSVGTYTR